MENEEIICLDTSVLIDFFRKKDKTKSFFFELTKTYSLFAVSVITEYEIMIGSSSDTDLFWNDFFERITVLSFDKASSLKAIQIFKQLKKDSKLIEIPDILIAATAQANQLKLATLNKKHFERINSLEIVIKN
nr:type II toxin-antitoxin system VapC family toxin [uncultured Flavobacterium sp.]